MASQEELVELLIDGARYGDGDDVQRALEGKVDVNAQDEWGKTGEARRRLASASAVELTWSMGEGLPAPCFACGRDQMAGERWAACGSPPCAWIAWQRRWSSRGDVANNLSYVLAKRSCVPRVAHLPIPPAALHMASANGHAEIVKVLLDAGAVRQLGRMARAAEGARWVCSMTHYTHALQACRLREEGRSMQQGLAQEAVRAAVCRQLPPVGTNSCLFPLPPTNMQNVATANESGNTALHWACLMGHEAVARTLLEAGANACALNTCVRACVRAQLLPPAFGACCALWQHGRCPPAPHCIPACLCLPG